MSVRAKLIAILLLPNIGLMYVGGRGVSEAFSSQSNATRVEVLTELSVHAGNLLHETQKERGITAGFLGSKNNAFDSPLVKQRAHSDEKIRQLAQFLDGFEFRDGEERFGLALSEARTDLAQLGEVRNRISSREISTANAIGFYTNLNTHMLDAVSAIQMLAQDSLRTKAAAYSSFLKGKERAGIERAVLANTFAADSFAPGLYRRFVTLVAEQRTYFVEFRNLASSDSIENFDTAQSHPSWTAVIDFRKVAHQHRESGGFGSDPTVWFAAATARINQLKIVEDALAEDLLVSAREVAATSSAVALTLVGIVALILSIALIVGIPMLRSVLRPLKRLSSQLSEIAEGEADLTKRLHLKRNDEIGSVGDAFDRFAERIRSVIADVMTQEREMKSSAEGLSKVVGRITCTTDDMNQASGVVYSHAKELSNSFGVIASASSETSNDVSTMAAAVEEVSTNLGSVSDRVEQISENFQTASDSIESLNASIGDVNERTATADGIATRAAGAAREASEEMTGLGAAASEIGQIVRTINTIAEQTNLLALNATIEAASAGDAGRGFAVVANEVKELAKQTSDATDSIRNQVNAIQNRTEQSIQRIADVSTVIDELNTISSQISKIVAEQQTETVSVSEMIATSAQDSRLAATAVGECSVGASETASSIERISAQAKEVAGHIGDVSERAKSILESAAALESSIGVTRQSTEDIEEVSTSLRGASEGLGQTLDLFEV